MTLATPPTVNRPTPKFASYWFEDPREIKPEMTPTTAITKRRTRAWPVFMTKAYDSRSCESGHCEVWVFGKRACVIVVAGRVAHAGHRRSPLPLHGRAPRVQARKPRSFFGPMTEATGLMKMISPNRYSRAGASRCASSGRSSQRYARPSSPCSEPLTRLPRFPGYAPSAWNENALFARRVLGTDCPAGTVAIDVVRSGAAVLVPEPAVASRPPRHGDNPISRVVDLQ